MARKRKRNPELPEQDLRKRPRLSSPAAEPPAPPAVHTITHPVLSFYFTQLLTLRDYLSQYLRTLPAGKRILKKLHAVSDPSLLHLLTTTLVGLPSSSGPQRYPDPAPPHPLLSQHTQSTPGETASQSQIVDLVHQLIFSRFRKAPRRPGASNYFGRPNNILAEGYRLETSGAARPGELGLVIGNQYPNSQVNVLKGPLWGRLGGVVGADAMVGMLLNTCLFVQLGEEGRRNYWQLTGAPVSDLMNLLPAKILGLESAVKSDGAGGGGGGGVKMVRTESAEGAKKAVVVEKRWNEIVFNKWKMFYAKPSHNKRGDVCFGLHHVRTYPIHTIVVDLCANMLNVCDHRCAEPDRKDP